MNQILLNISLILAATLLILEYLGFLFRLAGLKVGNLISGYSFQSSWAFAARFLNLLFAPLFAFLGDTGGIKLNFSNVIIYFSFLIFSLFFTIIKQKQVINLLADIIEHQQKGNNLISSFLRASVFKDFLKLFFPPYSYQIKNFFFAKKKVLSLEQIKINKLLKKFMITYIPFYGCWLFISLLITKFPSKPSFIISLSTYFTLYSSIYTSIIFDPYVSRIYNNKELTIYVYNTLQRYKLTTSIITFFIVCILFFITV